jgi:hypothetical protein
MAAQPGIQHLNSVARRKASTRAPHPSVIALVIAVSATIVYLAMPGGSIASRRLNFLFGICGTGMILFAGSLPLRKRIKTTKWPILGLQTWLKGHVWFGLVSILMVLLHARFRWGGSLTTALLVVLMAILFSGIAGLSFQHLIPAATTAIKNSKPGSKAAVAGRIILVGHQAIMFLHVPLTLTLLVLIAVHVVASLYYYGR